VAHWLIKQGLAWNYLVNANHALALIVMTAVWKQISYNFIFFLAGLQAIPKSMFEASAIDGGGPFKTFFYVTLPLLSPTAFFLLVVNVVYAFFDTFGIIDASTGGGPGTSTSILVYKVYNDGFKALDLGSSSAQSVILMILVVLLTVVQFRFIERRVHYG
jgi:sn-glycerol 3-phosphate transport system permease protein